MPPTNSSDLNSRFGSLPSSAEEQLRMEMLKQQKEKEREEDEQQSLAQDCAEPREAVDESQSRPKQEEGERKVDGHEPDNDEAQQA